MRVYIHALKEKRYVICVLDGDAVSFLVRLVKEYVGVAARDLCFFLSPLTEAPDGARLACGW